MNDGTNTGSDAPTHSYVNAVNYDWLRRHKVLYYRHYIMQPLHELPMCECCGVHYATNVWARYDTDAPYSLCSVCDTIAESIARDFVKKIKRAVFNPESESE